MAQVLFGNILRIAIISSIGIILILLLKKTIFKEYTKSFNYYIWLTVIVRMILPFKIPIYLNSDLVINKISALNNPSPKVETVNTSINNVTSFNSSLNTNVFIEFLKHFNIFEGGSYLWLSVMFIIISYRIFSYFKFKNSLVNLSTYVHDNKTNDIYNNLLIELNIKKNIILKKSDYTSMPLGIGVFKAFIILPSTHYKETELKWILKHELMHYKKNDLIYKFLVLIVSSIYWFNPLIYIMNKYINLDCELSCDEKILHKCDFNERQDYALALINSLKQNHAKLMNTNFATELGNKEILKRRFDSMLNRKTKRGIILGLLAITLAICSLGAVSTKTTSNISNETAANVTTTQDNEPIEAYELENSKYKGHYLIVKDPTRIKIGCSSKLLTEGEVTSEIAKDNNAVAAINGGGFANPLFKGNGGTPIGIVMSNGKVIYSDTKEDEKIDLFAITKTGILIVGKYSLNDLSNLDAQEALSFGPSLIINGEKTEMHGDGGWGIAPRTAIGQRKDGAIIMLAIDGRSIESLGITMKEEQEIMFNLGAVNAINLDGGASTTMYYNNEVINEPTAKNVDMSSSGKYEKKVPTAILVN